MPGMHAVDASPAHLPRVAPRSGALVSVLASIATLFAILALAIVPLLTPWFMHPALDQSQADAWLGVPRSAVHALSDRTVSELLLGPGTFTFPGPDLRPFYDPAEADHLRDVRTLLYLLLGAGAVSLIGLTLSLATRHDRRPVWQAISRAGAVVTVGVVGLAVAGLLAFDPLFELFHRVFFPGGNWAFDPLTEHLVQLYPFAFWQIAAAAYGTLVLALSVAIWWLARRWSRG
jgi:integral membrane protein (TIGR01906 family)